MVERAPKIVNGIPQHERKIFGDNGDLLDVKRYLSRVDTIPTPNGVWVGASEVLNGSLNLLDVLLGPIVFR